MCECVYGLGVGLGRPGPCQPANNGFKFSRLPSRLLCVVVRVPLLMNDHYLTAKYAVKATALANTIGCGREWPRVCRIQSFHWVKNFAKIEKFKTELGEISKKVEKFTSELGEISQKIEKNHLSGLSLVSLVTTLAGLNDRRNRPFRPAVLNFFRVSEKRFLIQGAVCGPQHCTRQALKTMNKYVRKYSHVTLLLTQISQ